MEDERDEGTEKATVEVKMKDATKKSPVAQHKREEATEVPSWQQWKTRRRRDREGSI